jgi:homoserine O-acetyltransferase/O-succinyltransferase
MRLFARTLLLISSLASGMAAAATISSPVMAATYPPPKPGDWIAHDFRFHDGETLPDVKLHYVTIGNPSGEPVLILHGTFETSKSLLTPDFAGALFGPGQPLDARKYFIIIPDVLGGGGSTKPSDGLRMKFPHYDYTDVVNAEYQLVHDGLGIKHLRLVMGHSMGGMETWIMGEDYPGYMDALVPMAAEPAAIGGRNWMMRRMLIDAIEADPSWDHGDYKTEPKALHVDTLMFATATNGGTLADQAKAPSSALGDALLAKELAAPFHIDADDEIYQVASASDYDPTPGLSKISAPVLTIDSADDERNPQETGLMEAGLRHVRHAHFLLIPASAHTHGHNTTLDAHFYAAQLAAFLASVPPRRS